MDTTGLQRFPEILERAELIEAKARAGGVPVFIEAAAYLDEGEPVGVIAVRPKDPSQIRATAHFYVDGEGELYSDVYDDGEDVEPELLGMIFRWYAVVSTGRVMIEFPFRVIDDTVLDCLKGSAAHVEDGYGTVWHRMRTHLGWARKKVTVPQSEFPRVLSLLKEAGYIEEDAGEMVARLSTDIDRLAIDVTEATVNAKELWRLVSANPTLSGSEDVAADRLDEHIKSTARIDEEISRIRAVLAAARSSSPGVAAAGGRKFSKVVGASRGLRDKIMRDVVAQVTKALDPGDEEVQATPIVAPLAEEIARLAAVYPVMSWIEVRADGLLKIGLGQSSVTITPERVVIDDDVLARKRTAGSPVTGSALLVIDDE